MGMVANQISNSKEAKFTSGYVFTLEDNAITWKSVKQKIIAKSTMKLEFFAFEMARNEVESLKNILTSIPVGMKQTSSISIHRDCHN